MQDLEFPFLTPGLVCELTGLSENALRRSEQERTPGPSRRSRGPKPSRPRLYSWREVEQIQQATHLLEIGRLSMDEAKRFLDRSHSAALDRDWVIARPKPKVRRGSHAGVGANGRGRRSARTSARRTP